MIEYKGIDNELIVTTKNIPQRVGKITENIVIDNYNENYKYFLELRCPKNRKYITAEINYNEGEGEVELPDIVTFYSGDVYCQLVIRELTGEVLYKSFVSNMPLYIVEPSINASEKIPNNRVGDCIDKIYSKLAMLNEVEDTVDLVLEDINNTKTVVENLTAHVNDSCSKINQSQELVENLVVDVNNTIDEVGRLKADTENTIDTLCSNASDELKTLSGNTANELKALSDNTESELNTLKINTANEIQTLSESTASEVQALRSDTANEIVTFRTNAEKTINDLGEDTTSAINALKSSTEVTINELNVSTQNSINEFKASAEGTINALSESVDTKISEINTIESNVGNLISEANELKSSIEQTNSEVNSVKNAVDGVLGEVNIVKNTIDSTLNEINGVKDSVTEVINGIRDELIYDNKTQNVIGDKTYTTGLPKTLTIDLSGYRKIKAYISRSSQKAMLEFCIENNDAWVSANVMDRDTLSADLYTILYNNGVMTTEIYVWNMETNTFSKKYDGSIIRLEGTRI